MPLLECQKRKTGNPLKAIKICFLPKSNPVPHYLQVTSIKNYQMKKSLLIILIISTVFSSAYSQWKATKGPYGGDINCFHEYNNTLYAGTGAGLFSSTDNGDSWNFVNIGFPASITAVANMGGRLFAGTGGKGIICSSDNGITWQPLNTGLSTYYRFCGDCITGFSVSGNTIFAATGDGLMKIDNNATVWTPVASGQFEVFSGNGQQMIYSQRTPYGPGSSCNITMDGGQTFRSISFPGPPSYERDRAASLCLSANGIFAITHNELLYSTDNGYNWISIYNDSLNNKPKIVKVIDNKVYLSTEGSGLLVSEINNFTWSLAGLPTYIVQCVYKYNNSLFAGTGHGRGIFKTPSGSYNWSEYNTGISGERISSFKSFKNIVMAGCEGGILISKDTGYTWKRKDLKLPGTTCDNQNRFNIEEIATNGKTILAGCSSGIYHNVFISVDSGETWNSINQPIDNILSGVAIIGNRWIVGTWSKLYYSDNAGITWNEGGLPAPNELWHDLIYKDSKLYITSFRGIYSSEDSASTWNKIPGIDSPLNFYLQLQDSTLFVTNSNGLYMGSTDGSNWMLAYGSGGGGTSEYKIGITKRNVFVSGYNHATGLIHSYDNGHTWTQEDIITNHRIEQMGSSDHYAYASIPGFGIWRYESPLVQSIEETDIFTSLIFPNPSTGSFTIRLNKPAKANICVYDVLGNCIERMQMNGRDQSVDLSGKAKGIYFVEVLVNEQKMVRKVTLN
jgi:photosystem II stability/assembly factor-like uncharacterized protein